MSLYIAAWRGLSNSDGERPPIVSGHPVFEAVVAVGGGSLQSEIVTETGVATRVYFARLRADEACHVAIGADPTATTANALKLGAGEIEWVGVPSGHRLAVIAGA